MAVAAPPRPKRWPYAAGALFALFLVFQVYWPAMYGPFLLDDTYLPYMVPGYDPSLLVWIHGVRPLLMFTYWLNFHHAFQPGMQLVNQDTFGYHMVNVALHLLNGALILLAIRKMLVWAGTDKWLSSALAVFAAGLFLLHPLQTESVSYVASRSETLSVFFVLAALVVFIYRKTEAVSVTQAIAVLALFGCAVLSKEHTAVFPAVLLLTDFYWNPGFKLTGIRRNWKLYVPIVAGAALGLVFVFRILRTAQTAGFGLKDLTWYQYFFTQCRVIWQYLLLFVLPLGQNVDPDVAISRSIADHGAIFGLVALVAVSAAAWIYRRRFPVVSYGWFLFLILMAPVSSFVPVRDVMAERRLYLPFIGLLLIVVEFARRWKTGRPALIAVLGAVLIAEAAAAYQRNLLWSSTVDLWKDSVAKSPNKLRPRFQLAKAYYDVQRYTDAVEEYKKAAQLGAPTFDLLVDWGLAYDGMGNFDEAVEKFRQAANLEASAHVYSQIGMEYGKAGKYPQALDALATAEKLDPNFAMTYYYRGLVYTQEGNNPQAAQEFRHVLAIDPQNQVARDALAKTQ